MAFIPALNVVVLEIAKSGSRTLGWYERDAKIRQEIQATERG